MDELVNQPTPTPTRKVAAVGYTGLGITALLIVLRVFGWEVTEGEAAEVASNVAIIFTAVTSIVNFIAGYWTKEKR